MSVALERFVLSSVTTADGNKVEDVLWVHPREQCQGNASVNVCVVHNPSVHHMRGWRLNWRDDRALMERICPHGIGHPDPDHMTYVKATGGDSALGVHGCDGCCQVTVRDRVNQFHVDRGFDAENS